MAVLTVAVALAPMSSLLAQGRIVEDSKSPFAPAVLAPELAAKIEMPVLDGPVDANDKANFDKYFYFYRTDTDVAAAFADIIECDGYARGLTSGYTYQDVPYPYTYTMAGAVGGAIGNAIAAAVFGSAEIRKARRTNMRTCMSYKGYQRFGLPKSLWTKFNFEEGLDSVPKDQRDRMLRMQALVAATAAPKGEVLEP